MKSYSPAYQQISAVIGRLEQNRLLYVPENFIERMQAADVLELQMLDEIEQVKDTPLTDAEKSSLIRRAGALKQKLADANESLFSHLLHIIRSNDRSTVKQYFRSAAQQLSSSADDNLGYDELDMLVNGLLEVAFVPAVAEARDADMFFYQPTPARITLKLIDELHMTSEDVFYDLGSGLGHVPILVNVLTGITTRGIELEASYVRYAGECLKKLRLSNVEFIHADARDADYADGTVFYLYTPFQGEMLRQVLAKLAAQAERRHIKVCTYGPCTGQVSKQNWLQSIYRAGRQEGSLGIFTGRSANRPSCNLLGD